MDTTFQVKNQKMAKELTKLLTAEGFCRVRLVGALDSKGPWMWHHEDGRKVKVELVDALPFKSGLSGLRSQDAN